MNITKLTAENAGLFAEIPPEVFRDNELFLGIGCLDDEGEPIGAAILDSNGEALLITSIYVDEESRLKGAGSLMLEGIREMAEAAGLDRVEAYFKEEEYEDFFLKNGYLVFQGAPVFRFFAEELVRKLHFEDSRKLPEGCVALGELKPFTRGELITLLRNEGYVSLPSQYDQKLSFVFVKTDGHPAAFLLTSFDKEKNVLNVDLLLNTEPGHPEYVIKLMEALAVTGMRLLTAKSEIEFTAGAENVFRFILERFKASERSKPQGYLRHAVLSV